MYDIKSRNNFINMLDNRIADIKRNKKILWPINYKTNTIHDYSNTKERRDYINMLSTKKELNEQSKNIDYQPFNPTLEQKSYFVNDGLTPEQLNTLSKVDYDKKKEEIRKQFKINLLSIVDPLLIDTIINNDLFKNSVLTQKFINDRWTHFLEKIKKQYANLSVEGFMGYAKEYIKKYNKDNNITVLIDESYDNKIKELEMEKLKIEKLKFLTKEEKERNDNRVLQIDEEIKDLKKLQITNDSKFKLIRAEEAQRIKEIEDRKALENKKYLDMVEEQKKNLEAYYKKKAEEGEMMEESKKKKNQMTILRVGSQVGVNEGSIVGVLVGLDGRIVEGLVVRVKLGRIDIVGDSVGTMNGSIVGASVGSKVGSKVGLVEGMMYFDVGR